jgi:hypothetical protein
MFSRRKGEWGSWLNVLLDNMVEQIIINSGEKTSSNEPDSDS